MKKITFMFLLVLSSCGPQLQRPGVSPEMIAREEQEQRVMALKLLLDRQTQLVRVAYKIRTHALDVCAEHVQPVSGFIAMDRDSQKSEMRAAAARMGFDDRMKIYYIVPGSPAEKAGLKSGDYILKVNGIEPQDTSNWIRPAPKSEHLTALLKDLKDGQLSLEIERLGQKLSFILKPEPACSYPTTLNPEDAVNAMTDGEKITVTNGMMRFIKSDDELGLIIGHELSHAALGHISKMRGNQVLGGLVGLLADIGMAAAGVNSGGAGMRAGMNVGGLVFSQDFEMEADYLGLYLAARAGFDISAAPDFFRRMAVEHPAAIGKNFLASHPSTPERAATMETVIKEIRGKTVRGDLLAPAKLPVAGIEVEK